MMAAAYRRRDIVAKTGAATGGDLMNDRSERPAALSLWDTSPLCQHAIVAALIAPVLSRSVGPAIAARFALALAISGGAQAALLGRLRRRLGDPVPAPVDALTLVRGTAGGALLALVACGARERPGLPRGIAFALLIAAVTTDWFDGPLARRRGPSRCGAVLDIEADSLLTLGAAAAAVVWGGLPRASLLPPLLRYRDPILALRRGEEPTGGGPWWCQASGAAQMALFLATLRPGSRPAARWRRPAALVVVAAQVTTQVLDSRRRNSWKQIRRPAERSPRGDGRAKP